MPRKSDLTNAAALLGRKGGLARAKTRTPDEQRAAARLRMARLTPAQRSSIARIAGLARQATRRARLESTLLESTRGRDPVR